MPTDKVTILLSCSGAGFISHGAYCKFGINSNNVMNFCFIPARWTMLDPA